MKKVTLLTLFLSLFGFQTTYSMEEIEPEIYSPSSCINMKIKNEPIDPNLRVKFFEICRSGEKTRSYLRARLYLDNKPIGKCNVVLLPKDKFATIDIIELEEEYRNKGFGSKFFDLILKHLENPERLQQLNYITLEADSDLGTPMEKLLHFYGKRGFEAQDELTQSWIVMTKNLKTDTQERGNKRAKKEF